MIVVRWEGRRTLYRVSRLWGTAWVPVVGPGARRCVVRVLWEDIEGVCIPILDGLFAGEVDVKWEEAGRVVNREMDGERDVR